MVAVGEPHRRMAELTLPRAEKYLGLSIELLTEGDPFVLKLTLLERTNRPVFFIDADAVVRSWSWESFQSDSFNAVHDYPVRTWAKELSEFFPLDRCINSGVWLASKKHRDVFLHALKLMNTEFAGYQLQLGDQTALNRALHLAGMELNLLPIEYNYQLPPYMALESVPADAKVVHLVGDSFDSANPEKKLDRVRKVVDAFPVD